MTVSAPTEHVDRAGRSARLARLTRHWPAASPVPKLARGRPGVAVVSLVATVLSWQPYTWTPVYASLDPSWRAGLAMGFIRQLQWGPSLVFTFGPYGFVDYIIDFYRLTALVALLFALTVTWGLAALIVSALRGSWGLLGAGVAAWAAVATASGVMGYSDLAAGTALALALGAALSRGSQATPGAPVAAGCSFGSPVACQVQRRAREPWPARSEHRARP